MCTSLRRRFCGFTVELSVEYRNSASMDASAFATMVTGWRQAFVQLWDGPHGHQHYRCSTVRFSMTTRVGSGTASFHQVNVVAGPQTSFVNQLGPACTGGRWDSLDTGAVVAHESGHLLGLPDEYDYGGPGGSYRNLNPQPAGQPQSLMAQTWGSVAVLQSHVDTTMQLLDARRPWWCCILWPLHRLRDILALRAVSVHRLPRELAVSMEGVPDFSKLTARQVLDRMEGGRPDVLAAGLERLRTIGPEDPAALFDGLTSSSPLVRWAAATALGDVRPDGMVERLIETLDDGDVRVRVAAVQSLARSGRDDGVPALLDALTSNQVMIGHPPVLVADHAAQLLEQITGAAPAVPADTTEARAAKWRAWWQQRR